jgi:hypothetical protein
MERCSAMESLKPVQAMKLELPSARGSAPAAQDFPPRQHYVAALMVSVAPPAHREPKKGRAPKQEEDLLSFWV